MSKRQIVLMMMIILVLLVSRIAILPKNAADPLEGDEPQYDSIALNLAAGHGYVTGYTDHKTPTAVRGPSYVLLLAAIYRVTGHHLIVPLAFQVILDAMSCLLLLAICRLLFRRMDVGLMAAFLYAVYPPFIIHTGLLLTEVLTNFTVLLSVYGFLDYRMSGRRSSLYLCAVVAAVGALSKPILFLLPFIFGLADYIGTRRKQVVIDIVVQCVVIGLISSPWIIRNAVVFHKFIPGVTQGGFTFWGGTGPANGRVIGGLSDPYTPKYVAAAIEGKNELEREKWFYQDGLRIVREHPARYAVLVMKKIPRLWFNLMHDDPPSKASIVLALFNSAAILLAFLGVAVGKPPRESHRLLLLLVLYFTLMHMVFFSLVRYAMPVYAYMFCFSASGIVAIAERLAARNRLAQALLTGKTPAA